MPSHKNEPTKPEPSETTTAGTEPDTVSAETPEEAQEKGFFGEAEDQAEDLQFPGPKPAKHDKGEKKS
jgi:hypothetical protein